MKKLQILIVISLLAFVFAFERCTTDNNLNPKNAILDTLSFSHSMKGWELYSWPNGNDWNYSILIGTNRLKTLNEVTTNPIIVIGKDSLKMLIDKFPAQEELFWIGTNWLANCWGNNYGTLSLPDSSTINEIKNYCAKKNVVLSVSE